MHLYPWLCGSKNEQHWYSTLVYYDHRTEGSKSGCYFNVNTTKTPASMRQVPMLGFVREAFEQEKQKQKAGEVI